MSARNVFGLAVAGLALAAIPITTTTAEAAGHKHWKGHHGKWHGHHRGHGHRHGRAVWGWGGFPYWGAPGYAYSYGSHCKWKRVYGPPGKWHSVRVCR